MPSAALAVRPAEELLPQETKFCLQIPDLDELRTNYNQTQLGHMINDPLMRPFVEDLRRQLRVKFDEAGRRIGLTWEELDTVDGGEICFARIQPNGDKTQYASVVIVDVTEGEGGNNHDSGNTDANEGLHAPDEKRCTEITTDSDFSS